MTTLPLILLSATLSGAPEAQAPAPELDAVRHRELVARRRVAEEDGRVADRDLAERRVRVVLDDPVGEGVPLGDLVNRSRFGPGVVGDADAEAAWGLSDAFTSARRRGRTVGQRAREYVALRAPARGRH